MRKIYIPNAALSYSTEVASPKKESIRHSLMHAFVDTINNSFFNKRLSVLLFTAFSIAGINSTVFAQTISSVTPNSATFGDICTGSSSSEQSFTITGTSLTTADVTVAALAGYEYSTVSGGPSYSSSLSIPQGGGSFNQIIYVRFSPAAVQSYNGDIVVGGGGAADFIVAVTGNGITTPATPGAIAGTAIQCPALTSQTYSISAITDATTYTWSVPTGWTITAGAGTTSITVTTGATGQNGNITVTAGNSCGTSAANSLAVTVSPGTPATPGAIAGTATQCPALTSQTYSISAVTDATTYTWAVPTGWTITAGAGTTSITVTTGATGQNGNITVTAGNSCGTSSASSLAVTVSPGTPATPGAIAGTSTQCPALTLQTYSISAVTNATTYTWTVPTGWTITAGVGTTSITVTTGATGQNGNITVTAGNSCGTSSASSLAVTVSPGTPATPGAITGTATQCPALTSQTYSISSVTDATTYTWAVPTGWTITSGAGTTSITVTTGATAQNGNITITAGNSCGTSAASSLAVTVSPGTPATPGAIAGTATQCPALTSQTYSISAVTNATTYTWAVPTGWTITSGAGTTSITVTTGATAQNGNITVTAGNSCGTSSAGSLAVTVSPGIPAAPGTITGTASQCPALAGQTYSVAAVTNATTYTWAVPTGWTITAGAGTTSITVTTGTSGQNGNISVTAGNSCGTSAASNLAVIVNAVVTPSVTIAANPAGAICAGTSVTFTATPTNGGVTPSYQWQLNGSPVGSNSSTYTNSTLAQGDKVKVILTPNVPCPSIATATSNELTITVNAVVIPSVAIVSTSPVFTTTPVICPGISVTFSATPTNGGTTPVYQWKLNGSTNVGTNSSTFTTSTLVNGDKITVDMTSNAVCASPLSASSNQITVTVNPGTPAVPGTITGTATVCPAITSLTYSIVAVTNATTYIWAVPTGWSITGGQGTTSITVTSGAAGQNGNVSVTAGNPCGTSAANTFAVTVSPGTPATPGTITGTTPVCPGITGIVYSVSAVANANVNGYVWTVPTGWSVTAGAGTNSITVTSGSTGQNGNITVTASNSCGVSAAQTIAVTVSAATPATPGAITGTTPVCPAVTALSYSISAVANATSYTWTVPTGWSITAGTGTNSITLTSGSTGQNGNITVTATNSCGTSSASSLAVTVSAGTPATPGIITGSATVCPAITSISYSIGSVSNATSYAWTVPTGWSITAGQGTTSITITSGSAGQNGNVSVTASNSCGTSSAKTLAVTVSAGTPATPGAITGSSPLCGSSTNNGYSISAVSNATTYTWSVPSGWTITSGQGTTSILVTAGSIAGNITVTAGNTCGTSSAQNLAVAITSGVPTTPGSITGITAICPTKTPTYSISAVSGATGYTWTVPANWAITSGQGTTTITTNAPLNAASGNISVTAYNVCGSSSLNSLAVTVSTTATVYAGPDQTVCFGTASVNLQGVTGGAISKASEWQWVLVSGGSLNPTTGSNAALLAPKYTFPNGSATTGTLTVVIKSNLSAVGCPFTTDTMNVIIIPTPTVTPGGPDNVCQSATPSAIPLSGASVGGGATTGAWVITTGGGTLSSVAQTATPSAVTYTPAANFTGTVTLTLTTNTPAACSAVSATRTINVNPAPTVTPGGPDNVCQSATPSALTLTGASVGGGATTGAWSITSGGGTLSSTAQTGTPATVTYTPAANFTGTVTLTLTTNATAPCLAVSATRTINVNAASTVTPGGPDNVCQSATPSAITLSGASVGGGATTGAWSITSGGGTLSSTAQTGTPSTVTYTPAANFTGTVTLTLTTNATSPCSAISATRTINVNAASTVTPGGPDNVCQSAAPSAITLSGASVGGGATTGAWSITSGGGTLSSTAQTGTPATVTYTPAANFTGTVTLTLTTNATAPCSAISATRTINVNAASTVTPGGPDNVCQSATPSAITLSGASVGGGATTGAWSITSGGGTLSSTAQTGTPSTVTYTPAANFTGTVTLTLTTNATSPCSAISATRTINVNAAATVSAGVAQTICSNTTATMAGSFGGGASSATWTTSGTGSFNNNTTAAIYTPSAADIFAGSVTLTYTTNDPAGPCGPVNANMVLTIKKAVVISTQPSNTSICASLPADLTVVATGDGLTYQWYKGIAPGGTAVANSANITGATSNNLHFNNTVLSDDGGYYVVVSGASPCSAVTSSAVILNVDQAITITTQPISQTICAGDNVTFNVVANANGDPLTYQWRKNGSNISGATGASLTINGLVAGDAGNYDVVITGPSGYTCSSANSNSAVLTVNPVSVGGTVSSAQTICNGSTPANLTLGGNTGTVVKWQKASDLAFTTPIDIAGTSTTLTGATIGALSTSTYFRAVVQSGICSVANSSPVLITVDPTTVAGTVSTAQTICNGSTPANLTLGGNTGTVVKWQKATNAAFTTPTDIANTTTTLTGATIGALSTSTYFRAVVQSGSCLVANSSSVLITVDPTTVAGTVSSAQTICNGSAPANLTLAGNTGTVVKWQKASDLAFTTPTDIAITTTTLTGATIGALATSTYFRAVVQSGTCLAANSSSVLITVDPTSVGGTLSSAQTICSGSTPANLNLAGNTGTVVKWQKASDAAFTTPTDIANTTTTLTGAAIGALSTSTYFRAVVQSGSCVAVNSSSVLITVNPTAVGGSLSPALKTECFNLNSATINLSGQTGSVIRWEQSIDFGTSWTTISNLTTSLSYTNLTQTTFYRAVLQSGVCVATANSAIAQVIVNPAFVATITPSPAATCVGVPVTLAASGYTSSGLVIDGGDFSSTSPINWGGMNGNASNNNTATDFIWGYTNPGKTYSGNRYSSSLPLPSGGGSIFITAGTPPTNPSILTTPTFSTVGLSTAVLVFNEAFDLRAGTTAKVEISTDGGATYTTLKTYSGTAFLGPTNGMTFLEAIDLNAYLGRSNLKLRFNYLGSPGSVWAIDNVVVTNSVSNPSGVGALTSIGYSWSPAADLNVTNTQSVILTPTTSGSKIYTVTATAGSCTPTSTNVTITVNPLPTATISGTTAVCVGAASPNVTFTGAAGTAPYTFTYKINGGSNLTVTTTTGNSVTVAAQTGTAGSFVYTLVSVQDASSTACNQLQTGSVTITVNPLPTATISGTTAVCVGSASPNVTFTGAAGTGPYTFTYKINGGSNLTVTTISGNSVTVAASTGTAGSLAYTLVSVQDASSTACTQLQTGTATITVNPLPTATVSGTTAVCVGSASPNITFTGAAGTAPYTFTYKINGGANLTVTTISGNSIIVAVSTGTAGSFVYTLVSVQDASSSTCSQLQSATATVTVNPLPTATISGTTAVCVGSASPNITFTGAAGTAPYTFTYKINGGSNLTVTTISGNSVTVAASTGTAGSYVYTLVSVQDASSTACTQLQSGTATITVNPLPTATIGGTTAVCVGSASPNITFTGAAGTAPYTFTYKINGGSNLTVTTISGNSVTVAASTGTAGSFAYTLVSVQDASSTACTQLQAGTATITVDLATLPGTLPSNISVCTAGTNTLTLSGSVGSITRWESSINGGSTWANIANTTTSYTIIVSAQTTLYRVLVQSGVCASSYSTITIAGLHNVWTGAISTNWQVAGNWSDGILPNTSCADVIIPNVTNKPVLSSGSSTITNLVVQSLAQLTINDTGVLQIGGTITNSGTFDVTNGTVELNGSSPQTIPASAFSTNTIKNLVISNGVSLGGTLDLTGNLSFGSSSKTFATGGFLTLKSSATNTAALGQVINGNNISGSVTVERFISAKRAWRFLSVPTGTTQTVHEAWQENMPQGSTTPSNPVGYGTQVTDAVAPTVVNGFDYFSPAGPSVKKYIPATNTYVGIASTNVPIATTEGWMTFVRGDRTAAGLYAAPTTTILRTKGPLFIGSMSAIPVTPGEFKAIANPYAAALDMRNISKTNVPEFFTVWDPNLTGALGFGAPQTFTLISGEYYPTPGGGSYPSQSTATPYNFIQSGLAFFVQGGGSTGSVDLAENAKAITISNNLVFKPTGGIQEPLLRTNLYIVGASGEATLLDGTLNLFGDYDNKVDDQDGRKMTNNAENLAIKTDSQLLVVERRQDITREDTIFLNMQKMRAKSYRFEFAGQNFDALLTAFLEDSYVNTRLPINLNGSTRYEFTVEDIPGSWNPDRFRIVFKKLETGPLPVTYKDIKAYQQQANIAVEWTVENERNMSKYEVEKSTNGINYVMVNTSMAIGSGRNSTLYKWLDINPVYGNNFYRIRGISLDGKFDYSKAVVVKISQGMAGIAVYPNPVVNGTIGLAFSNMPGGIYKARLFNSIGQTILNKQVNHATGTSLENIRPDYRLVSGIYKLEITTPDKTITTIKLLVK